MYNEIYISGGKHRGFEIDIVEENIRDNSKKTIKVKEPTEVVVELMRTLKIKPYHLKKIRKDYFEKEYRRL